MNRKTSHLSCSKLCIKDYLKQLPPSLARVVFMAKTRTLDIKTNYKNKYFENLKCPFVVCMMNHLTTFSAVDLRLQFPKKLYTSGYSPLVQKFHCQFLKDWEVFYKILCIPNLSGWLITMVSGMLFCYLF